MSYVTYTTEAFVCGTFNRSTADRSYLLFTREAGMLFADARSVREERSRQRYALQDFSEIRVSLIRGKQGWKIGSVEGVKNDFSAATTREVRGSVVILYRLLRRFIHGEEASVALFDFFKEALAAVVKPVEERSFLELCIQLRFLAVLGYVDTKAIPDVLKNTTLSEAVTYSSEALTTKITDLIERGIENSQL
jgi:recombinational DNA repair protein (RecF pathway)